MSFVLQNFSQLDIGIYAMVRRTSDRETGVSPGLMGDQRMSLLKPREYQHNMVPRRLREALNWVPIMPRDVTLSRKVAVIFFQSKSERYTPIYECRGNSFLLPTPFLNLKHLNIDKKCLMTSTEFLVG